MRCDHRTLHMRVFLLWAVLVVACAVKIDPQVRNNAADRTTFVPWTSLIGGITLLGRPLLSWPLLRGAPAALT